LTVLLYRTVDALKKASAESSAAAHLTHAAALDSTPYMGDADAAPTLATASVATAVAECAKRSAKIASAHRVLIALLQYFRHLSHYFPAVFEARVR
jgi:hypothetical protein